MFCPLCGAETSEQLKYCRSCGTNLNPTIAPPKPVAIPSRLILLFLTIALVGIVGLVGVLTTGVEMVKRGTAYDLVMTLLVFGSLMTFTVLGILGWLLSRLIRLAQQGEHPSQTKIGGSDRPALPPPAPRPDVIPSVVEHTTRSFSPVPPKDKAHPY